MNRHGILAAFGASFVATGLLAGCASTQDFARVSAADCAPSVGTRLMQFASLPQFRENEPDRAPLTAPVSAGADDRDVQVCRAVPPATGSRLGTRMMCMTGDEWAGKAQDDRDTLSDAETRALAGSPNPEF